MNSCEMQADLVSSDPVVVNSVSESLEKLGIAAAVYRETSAAIGTLSSQKTDAFLVDRELDPELSVLKAMRHSSSSRNAVAFAICSQDSSAKGAFRRQIAGDSLEHAEIRVREVEAPVERRVARFVPVPRAERSRRGDFARRHGVGQRRVERHRAVERHGP